MAEILDEEISIDELKQFENVYHDQLNKNEVTTKSKFEYAYCLIRSKYPGDIKKGIIFLEELCQRDKDGTRDYLYYLAVANAKIKQYSKSLNYIKAFLEIEPGNQQMLSLESVVRDKMRKEGLTGIAIAGGIAVGVGAILGIGLSLAKRK